MFLGHIWRYGYVNEGLRPIAAEVGESTDFAIGNGHQGTTRIADDSAAQGKMLDAALRVANLDGIANDELVLEDDVKAGDDVTDEILSAKAKGKGGQAGERGNGKDVDANLLRGGQQRHGPDNLATRAVNYPGKRAGLLFSRLCGTGLCGGWLDDQVGSGVQEPVQRSSATRRIRMRWSR